MMKSEDVIASDFLEVYHQEFDVILQQFIWANNNLHIIKEIVEFPFDLFTLETDRTFWVLASKAFFDSTILALWTVLGDEESEFRLNRFCSKILTPENLPDGKVGYKRHDISDETESELRRQLKEVDFEKRIKQLRTKLDDVRNHFVAHLDYDVQLGRNTLIQYRMDYRELQQIVDIGNELLLVLGFDVEHLIDFWNYVPRPQAKNYTTDIQNVLTFVASQSIYIRRFGTPSEITRTRSYAEKLPDDKKEVVAQWQKRVNELFSKG